MQRVPCGEFSVLMLKGMLMEFFLGERDKILHTEEEKKCFSV